MSTSIADVLADVDRLAGAVGSLNGEGLTVPALEAWYREQRLPWNEAREIAISRLSVGGGKITSWLEGYLVGCLHERHLTAEVNDAARRRRHQEPPFDPITAQTAETSAEALELARAWADGRRSHWNDMLAFEASDQHGPVADARQRSMVACTQADAAEVTRWGTLAAAMATIEARA